MKFAQRALALLIFVVLLAACGSDSSASETASSSSDRPVVVATTNILGDVLKNIAGDQFDVVTIMPVGSDPHDFQPSARDIAAIAEARAIISNGAFFEEGLLDAVEAAEGDGVPVFEATSAISTLEYSDDGHEDHGDEDHDDHGDEDHDDHGDEDHDDHGDEDHDDHGDEDHDDHGDEDHDDHGDEDHGDEDHDDHGHEAGSVDPHFFTDPARMATVADGIVDFLVANVDDVDAEALRASADSYIDELNALDEEVETILASVPDSRRVLVTNHQVFGYFAERYEFEVIGTVIPPGSSTDGVSGQRLAELTALLEAEGVRAIFADTSASEDLAQTLAAEVGEVSVVKLFTESLGEDGTDGATYVEMVRSNANQISEALSG